MTTAIKQNVKHAVRNGYVWPGAYQLHVVTTDGGTLCTKCTRENWLNVAHSVVNDIHDGWNVDDAAVNWEDADLSCDHCSDAITPAYGDDE